MTNTKTEYATHLEKVLKDHDIEIEIDSKESLKKGYSHLLDLSVYYFYEADDSTAYKDISKEQEGIIERYLQEGNQLFVSSRNEVLVTPSAKEQGSYQVTYFDEKGAVSDSQQETLAETVSYIRQNGILPLPKEQAEYLNFEGVQRMTQPTERQQMQQRQQILLKQRSMER